MQRRRVNFHTLGCKLNFSESSTLAREFEAGGFIRVGVSEAADISVINSCSVTEHADKKCRNLIRKIHRRNPAAIIVVTGCYAQLKPQEIDVLSCRWLPIMAVNGTLHRPLNVLRARCRVAICAPTISLRNCFRDAW